MKTYKVTAEKIILSPLIDSNNFLYAPAEHIHQYFKNLQKIRVNSSQTAACDKKLSLKSENCCNKTFSLKTFNTFFFKIFLHLLTCTFVTLALTNLTLQL